MAWVYDCIHCFMCNGITCWLSIVDASNFNVWMRACMSNYTSLFYNEVILIQVLTPALRWQISVCKRNPFWRISGSGIEPVPALLVAYFQLDHQGQTLMTQMSTKHGGAQEYFRPRPSYYIFEQETCKLMIMASSHGNGNTSRVTCHPWAESTGYQGRANIILHDPWTVAKQLGLQAEFLY